MIFRLFIQFLILSTRSSPPSSYTTNGCRIFAFGQSFLGSLSILCIPPPPCVKNGAIVLFERLCNSIKDTTGGASVPHQFGDPRNTMS